MAHERFEAVVRRVDISAGTVTVVSHGRILTLPFDLTPTTPDYKMYINQNVYVALEDGVVQDMSPYVPREGEEDKHR